MSRVKNSYAQAFLQQIYILVDGRFLVEKSKPKERFRASCNKRINNVKTL